MNKVDYSFYPIDIENFINIFQKNRIEMYSSFSEKNFFKKRSYKVICGEIFKKFDYYNDFKIKSKTFKTLDFIQFSIHSIILTTNLDKFSINIVYNFQKKFEIFNKLYSSYDKDSLTKVSKNEVSIHTYIFFSILLLMVYKNQKNYGLISTSFKITDFVLIGNNKNLDKYKDLICLLIELEFITISQIIDF